MAFNPKRNQECKIDLLLSKVWESGITGQQAIDKMKDILKGKGKFPLAEDFAPPEWVDAIFLRFFIGFKKNPAAAAEAFSDMLDWLTTSIVLEIILVISPNSGGRRTIFKPFGRNCLLE